MSDVYSPFDKQVRDLAAATQRPAVPQPSTAAAAAAPAADDPYAAIVAPPAASSTAAPAQAGPDPYATLLGKDNAAPEATPAAAPPEEKGLSIRAPRGDNAPWWWLGPGSGPREMLGLPEVEDNGAGFGETAKNFALNLPRSAAKHAGELFDTVTDAVSKVVSDPSGAAHAAVAEIPNLPHDLVSFGGNIVSHLVNRYGGFNAFKKTAAEDPAGLLLDASTVLPIGSAISMAAKAGGRTALGAADAIVGTANGVAEGALKKMFESGQKVTPGVWKTMTGGMDWDKSFDLINDSAGKLIKNRSDNYITDMSRIKGADVPVDFARVDKAVNDATKIGYYKAPGDKSPGPGIRLDDSPAVQSARGQILAKVYEWKLAGPEYHTAVGFDSLKQSVAKIAQDLRGTGPTASPESVFANKIAGSIRQTIMDAVPEYGAVMKQWGDDTDKLKAFAREFKTGDASKKLQAVKSMQQVWRNTAAVGHGEKTNMLADVLKQTGNEDLMNHLAASSYHTWKPHGLRTAIGLGVDLPMAIGHAIASPATGLPHLGAVVAGGTLMSPRVAGTLAYGAGRASPFARQAERAAGAAGTGMQIQNQMPPPEQRKRGGFFRGAK